MKNNTILIVDDTITNLDILVDLLDKYNVIEATSGKDALEIVSEDNQIDLILLDIMMPEMDGFEVCTILKSHSTTKDIPIIFITALTDEDNIEEAYDIGGIDYITKPFLPKELLAKVKRELKLQVLQNELKILVATDPMTKLYNRRYFTEISETILDLAKRDKKDLCIVMLDIDKFKLVNDTYGHKIGDDVIIRLAQNLQKHQRKSDIICRYGGEEFVILLPNTSIDGAKIVSENIRASIEDLTVKIDDNQSINFTVSMGVSQVHTNLEQNIEPALKRADEALYEAKEIGRNRVCTFV